MIKNILVIMVIGIFLINLVPALQSSELKNIIKTEYNKISQGQESQISEADLRDLIKFYLKDSKQEYPEEDLREKASSDSSLSIREIIQNINQNQQNQNGDGSSSSSSSSSSSGSSSSSSSSSGGANSISITEENLKCKTVYGSEYFCEPSYKAGILQCEGTKKLAVKPNVNNCITDSTGGNHLCYACLEIISSDINSNDLIGFITKEKFYIEENKLVDYPEGEWVTPGKLEGLDTACNEYGKYLNRNFKALAYDNTRSISSRFAGVSGRVVNTRGDIIAEEVGTLISTAETLSETERNNIVNNNEFVKEKFTENVLVDQSQNNLMLFAGGIVFKVEDFLGQSSMNPNHIICIAQAGSSEGFCGDQTLDASEGEECDDGNNIDYDGCSADCKEEYAPENNCGDNIIGLEETCDDGNIINGDGCSSTCQIEFTSEDHIWFITNNRWSPWDPSSPILDLGGLEGADEKCNEAGANFTGKYFRAILSTSFLDAKDRIPPTGRILNVNNQVIAQNKTDLFPINKSRSAPTNLDQNGFGKGQVWWASDKNGIKKGMPGYVSTFCGDWKRQLVSPQSVAIRVLANNFKYDGGVGCITGYAHLICISQ